MYILDSSNCRVLQWTPGDPMGFPVAGDNGCGGSLTQLDVSYSMFVDSQYNMYISESSNHRVTLWTAANTTAGTLVCYSSIRKIAIIHFISFLFYLRLLVDMVLEVRQIDFIIHGVFTSIPIKCFM